MSLIKIMQLQKNKTKSKKLLNYNLLASNMLNYHEERLYYLLSRHYKFTGSKVASKILKNFNNSFKSFKLVMPIDYKKALIEIENEKLLQNG